MPSSAKTLFFILSASITALAVGFMGWGMSTGWARTTMECTSGGSSFFNGTAMITLRLFGGILSRSFCPSFGQKDLDFQVVPKLIEMGSDVPVALHALVLCLLALCLLFSACSILISLYNAVSNPYETYMGPMGIYVCSSLSTFMSVVVLAIFAVNVNVTNMAEGLVESFSEGFEVGLRNKSSELLLGYYLVIPYTGLSLCAIVVIYFYEHAAYKQRREQQRPTEDAPKEIMMY
ncbi:clarin-3 [Hippoglossus hippoglossus]|uniref:clarin-3 n=1 Tax=Hippoglossus hippoglossus TaxID=8267 RepID=UPI00148DD482|nr:clarin-3 [Hippoglossus hippoglossus]